jgi:hypothetical protein
VRLARATFLVVLEVACRKSGPELPVNPGGGGGGGGGGSADATATPGDAILTSWRACLLIDLRDLEGCADTGAGGLAVTLGRATATTSDDGAFTIATPLGTDLVWRITGSAVVPAIMPYGTAALIPVIRAADYTDLQSNNGVLLSADQGAVMLRVVQASQPLVSAVAQSNPQAQYPTFYDATSATAWSQHATGAHGTAWLPGFTAGNVELTVTPPGGSATPAGNVAVEAGAITFEVADIP